MTSRIFSGLLILSVFTVFSMGCAQLKKQSEEEKALRESITDGESLVRYLQREGVSLIHDGKFTSPEMTTSGEEYTVTSGGGLYIFRFPNPADATAALSWVRGERDLASPVQMYQKEDLVVIFVGEDPRVERALVRVMGSRVA